MNPRQPINKADYELLYAISLMGVLGQLYLSSEDELARYLSDPDRFAAEYLGFTVDEYREWIRLGGDALCSERQVGAGLPLRSEALLRS
jgi:hypothetical protein